MPALTAFVVQLSALVITLPLISIFPSLTLLQWALLQGIVAATISYRFKMALWWMPIQLAFVPAVLSTLALGLSPLWFGCGFLLLLLTYGKTFQTQVPLYLSSTEAAKAVTALLPKQENFSFMDLGCGCGGLLSALSQSNSKGHFHGIEAAPIPCLIGKMRNLFAKSCCRIHWGNLWRQNLSQYDVVYAYLSPVPMPSLWKKVCSEMRPGSLFISNTFKIPGVDPEQSIKLNDFSGSTIYVWRI